MFNLLAAGWQLLHRTAVYDIYLFSAESQSGTCGVHSNISSADYGNPAAFHNRGFGVVAVRLHKIGAGQELVGGINSLICLSGYSHKIRKSCARAYEHSFKALLKQLVNGEGFSYNNIGFNVNTHCNKVFNLFADDGFRQTEFRNTVNQNAACGMKRLKNGYLIALFGKVSGAGQSRRSGAYNRNPVSV